MLEIFASSCTYYIFSTIIYILIFWVERTTKYHNYLLKQMIFLIPNFDFIKMKLAHFTKLFSLVFLFTVIKRLFTIYSR